MDDLTRRRLQNEWAAADWGGSPAPSPEAMRLHFEEGGVLTPEEIDQLVTEYMVGWRPGLTVDEHSLIQAGAVIDGKAYR